tara:strand:+ start:3536 stop:4078 length:543 start_codon:yes stop_codon:yes gene_type:complete
VADLLAQFPANDLLPLRIGKAALEAVDPGTLTSLSPFGDEAALSDALQSAMGVALPKPGRSTAKDGTRCIWFGRDTALLIGPQPAAALADHGAVVDVSDGWAAVSLSGAASVDVLARLVPLDLRPATFKIGHTARCQVQHMAASITRTGADAFLILAFRSMIGSLVHDVKQAMAAVASRG